MLLAGVCLKCISSFIFTDGTKLMIPMHLAPFIKNNFMIMNSFGQGTTLRQFQSCRFAKNKVPFSMAIGNVELMHEYFHKHSRMGTARMK